MCIYIFVELLSSLHCTQLSGFCSCSDLQCGTSIVGTVVEVSFGNQASCSCLDGGCTIPAECSKLVGTEILDQPH